MAQNHDYIPWDDEALIFAENLYNYGDFISYMANKLAALTGMRASEVLGLRGEYVFDDHIYLCAQYDEYGYRETKTKDKHNIPLPAAIIAELRKLQEQNGVHRGTQYVLTYNRPSTPDVVKTIEANNPQYRGVHLQGGNRLRLIWGVKCCPAEILTKRQFGLSTRRPRSCRRRLWVAAPWMI